MSISTRPHPFRLGLLLFPGCMPAGLFVAADLVRACNLRAGAERLTVAWIGLDGSEVAGPHGPSLCAQKGLNDGEFDAVLLPGLWLASPDALEPALRHHGPLIERLRALPARTAVWSYCAGVALAAAAGRLDGHVATATWWLQPLLAARFPKAHWRSGFELATGRNAITAAGPSGYLPLMLDRLGAHYPAETLQDVQELLMLPSPRPSHAAFAAVDVTTLDQPELRALLLWTERTPAQDVTLDNAARELHVSVRTLCRRIRVATGLAAGDWLRRAKLSQVADALRTTRAPIKTISDRMGFNSDASLQRSFRSVTGLTPSAYRLAFGASARATAS